MTIDPSLFTWSRLEISIQEAFGGVGDVAQHDAVLTNGDESLRRTRTQQRYSLIQMWNPEIPEKLMLCNRYYMHDNTED